jgi:hypothetical protein
MENEKMKNKLTCILPVKNKFLLIPLILIASIVIAPTLAHADWARVGVATFCDTTSGKFGLFGTLETDFSEAKPNIPKEYVAVNKSKYQEECKIGAHIVKIALQKLEPQDKGHGLCAGVGVIHIENFFLDDEEIVFKNTIFNSGCFFKPTLVSIEISQGKNVIKIESCEAESQPDFPSIANYKTKTCNVKIIENK